MSQGLENDRDARRGSAVVSRGSGVPAVSDAFRRRGGATITAWHVPASPRGARARRGVLHHPDGDGPAGLAANLPRRELRRFLRSLGFLLGLLLRLALELLLRLLHGRALGGRGVGGGSLRRHRAQSGDRSRTTRERKWMPIYPNTPPTRKMDHDVKSLCVCLSRTFSVTTRG